MENPREIEVVEKIINFQSRIQKRVGGALSVHGIGLSEYLVLNLLSQAPNRMMRRTDLADQVGLSPSGITRLLNPMEKIGLVVKEKNPRDARVSLVSLTEAGARIHADARTSFEHASVSLFDALDKKQLTALTELLRIVT